MSTASGVFAKTPNPLCFLPNPFSSITSEKGPIGLALLSLLHREQPDGPLLRKGCLEHFSGLRFIDTYMEVIIIAVFGVLIGLIVTIALGRKPKTFPEEEMVIKENLEDDKITFRPKKDTTP
jgi:hypothetical protein